MILKINLKIYMICKVQNKTPFKKRMRGQKCQKNNSNLKINSRNTVKIIKQNKMK